MSNVSMANAEKVMKLMEQAADTMMLPYFGNLSDSQITTKLDKSIVTEVDMAVEKFLTEKLLEIFPDTSVIGEEMVEADSGSVMLLEQDQPLWVIDPLDGTKLFANKQPGWGILITYMEHGVPQMAFVLDVLNSRNIIAVKDQGVFLDGKKLEKPETVKPLQDQQGVVWSEKIQDDAAQVILDNEHYFQIIHPSCPSSVVICFLAADGEVDFATRTNTKAWDFLPLVLILDELGGRSGKVIDGHDFSGKRLTASMELAMFIRHREQWDEIREKLFENLSMERIRQGIRKII